MTLVRCGLACFPFVLMALGCGGDPGTNSGQDGSMTPVQLGDGGADGTSTPTTTVEMECDSAAEVYCSRWEQQAPLIVRETFGDKSTCVQRMIIACQDDSRAPNTGATAATIRQCADAFATASLTDTFSRNVPACEIRGSRQNGSSCGVDVQCQSGYCAKRGTACGTCAPLGKAGGRCEESPGCEAGLFCNQAGNCVSPGSGGTACNTNQPCQLGFYCKNGSCLAQAAAAGDSCDGQWESCDSTKGIFCQAESRRCQKFTWAGAGDVCGFVGSSLVACEASAICLGSGLEGVCSAAAQDGESCGNDKPCMYPSTCVNGRCLLPNSPACN